MNGAWGGGEAPLICCGGALDEMRRWETGNWSCLFFFFNTLFKISGGKSLIFGEIGLLLLLPV